MLFHSLPCQLDHVRHGVFPFVRRNLKLLQAEFAIASGKEDHESQHLHVGWQRGFAAGEGHALVVEEVSFHLSSFRIQLQERPQVSS